MVNGSEFKTIPRKTPEHLDPKSRIKNFEEIHHAGSDKHTEEQASRCMDCGIPFCHDTYGCPLGNLIPEWNALISQGKWKEAVERMLETDTFPEFTGKICPAPCEGACTMGLYNNQPVTIQEIELTLAEKGFANGWIKPMPPLVRVNKSIAIIGGGPAGLSAAFYLNRAGFTVKVYEKSTRPGGLLTYGIPNYKLDKQKIVKRRIDFLKEEGVQFETGIEVGKDISPAYLKKQFDAVLITVGAEKPRDLPIPGRELGGVHFAMEFLSRQSMKLAGEPLPEKTDITAKNKNVVIIGGGDTGSDCLGTSHRQGATNIIQLELTPPPPKGRAEDNPWPLWPLIYRTSSSHEEGGERKFSVMTKEFFGENGQVKGIRCVKAEMVKDKGGIKFVEIPDSDFEIKADLVLLAMGFLGPNKELPALLNLALNERQNIKVDQNMMTSVDGIFAAGDAATGQSLVVRAIASGRDAAFKVMDYLKKSTSKK
jgi:NAD(P)H-dependent glutamate synthase small subunit